MTRTAALSRAARDAFLSHLAETSNVAASARKAKLPPARFYTERRRSEAFRAAWQEALCEGFARLEAELLAEALRPAKASDPTGPIAVQQQKTRLGLALLAHHRAAVRGTPPVPATARPSSRPSDVRARLSAKLDLMRERMTDDSDPAQQG